MRTLARRSFEGATLYLPVILMGLLALGTWWLVRNTPQAAAPTAAVAPKHEPDYFMSDFSV
ncbi:MAG: LPS export ABC transporter periplasmic protein LptC, partial [Burkholderiaceae bacterium]|nr:LPS export ABC transporter periplasmic protein LptC [Burkholderiaceae bacterium]